MLSLLPSLFGCGGRSTAEASGETETRQHPLPDTLRVATLYSPTSYFLYRDQEMGYDYNLVTQWAEEKGMVVKLTVAPSMGVWSRCSTRARLTWPHMRFR